MKLHACKPDLIEYFLSSCNAEFGSVLNESVGRTSSTADFEVFPGWLLLMRTANSGDFSCKQHRLKEVTILRSDLWRRSAAARQVRLWVRIPMGGIDVCRECCVLLGRVLRRADHSSRGVLPIVVRRCV